MYIYVQSICILYTLLMKSLLPNVGPTNVGSLPICQWIGFGGNIGNLRGELTPN